MHDGCMMHHGCMMDPSILPHNPSIRSCILPSIPCVHPSPAWVYPYMHPSTLSYIYHALLLSHPSTHPSLQTYIHAHILPSTLSPTPTHPSMYPTIHHTPIMHVCHGRNDHNHILQTNPWHREEESKNDSSDKTIRTQQN